MKKAREAASRERRQKDLLASDRGKKPRVSVGADNQFFRGSACILLCEFTWFGSACILPYSLSDLFVLREFNGKIIYVRLN